MATTIKENRATELAAKAIDSFSNGKAEEASRALREALSLAPENGQVRQAFARIQADEATQPLLKLCRRFAQEKDIAAGKEALSFLNGGHGPSVPTAVADTCFHSVVGAVGSDPIIRDGLVASLVQHCLGARTHLANLLQSSLAIIFSKLFDIGDGAANGITVVSLDAAAWPNESTRRSYEKDVFLLFLAKLLESGHDNDGRALKGISRHLAVDAERLHDQVDEESFDSILVCLDYRLPQDIRGQATLATAKYLEASKQTGEHYLKRFITIRTAKHASEDLVLAFSVAAAVFPIATPLISALFLVEGFLPSLIPLLDKKARPIKVEKAALDMLSAACIDGGCREAISKHCWDWMHHVMEDEEDERHGQAALILAKAQSQPIAKSKAESDDKKRMNGNVHTRRPSKSIADVVPALKNMVINGSEIDKRTGVEGLAYASVQPFVKDEIIRDTALLDRLFGLPRKDTVSPTTAFGFLTMVDNLTQYLPNISEEQQKMSELKAYAAASGSKPDSKPHPLDEEDAVTARCKRLLDSSVVAYLVTLKSTAVTTPLSPSCLNLISKILLSISKTPSSRGSLAQQGSIPLLLQIQASSSLDPMSKATAAHALARILISVDPALIPSYTAACIPPLLTLLDPSTTNATDSATPHDLLPTFESLLALTNLVSDPLLPTGSAVVKSAFTVIEDLLLHTNPMIQRAATELVCNLGAGAPGLEKLADGSAAAARRLHVLLALADAEDVATRRAASGALTGCSEFEGAVRQILKREGGVERCLGLCGDEDRGVVHRGVTIVRNMICCEGTAGEEARVALKEKGATEVLVNLVKGGKPEAVEVAVETLRALSAQAEQRLALR